MSQLILPWPSKDLSPNGRAHWSKKAKAVDLSLHGGEFWSESEVADLISTYAVPPDKTVDLAGLAKRLGRDKANVCRKARSLGLTNQRRPRAKKTAPPKRKYATIEEARASIGAATSKRLAEKGHPRGALGMKHTPETLARLGEASRCAWADPKSRFNTDAHKQKLSDNMIKNIAAGKMRSGYLRSRGGKRDDLGGIYFRSAWEANYARYLNFLLDKGELVGWQYEPKTFIFEKIKRGTRAYTPDFLIQRHDGGQEWHEVKGWMDAKSKTRLARFARYYPDEKLIVVDAAWFKAANTTIGRILPNWEGGTVRS